MAKHWTYEKSFEHWLQRMHAVGPKTNECEDGVDWIIEHWIRLEDFNRRTANDSRMHPAMRQHCREAGRQLRSHLSCKCGEHMAKFGVTSLPRYGCYHCVTQEGFMGVSTAETLGV